MFLPWSQGVRNWILKRYNSDFIKLGIKEDSRIRQDIWIGKNLFAWFFVWRRVNLFEKLILRENQISNKWLMSLIKKGQFLMRVQILKIIGWKEQKMCFLKASFFEISRKVISNMILLSYQFFWSKIFLFFQFQIFRFWARKIRLM